MKSHYCDRQNLPSPPANAHALIPGVCEYVMLHLDKKDFAAVTKVTDLKGGIILDHPGGPSLII